MTKLFSFRRAACIFFMIFFIMICQVQAQLKPVIDVTRTVQVIDNFGASAAWFSENIGKYWPAEKKEQMAQWLFSKETDKNGNPLGIGLSAFRFNIGGGTAEQGDSSGIRDFRRRVESFLKPDGTYNWTKQSGYLWFVRKAKSYGIEKLIAFSNTPPVQFTQNGLGYKTEKDYVSNLRVDKYGEYAVFLATVLDHFNKEGLHFDLVSPVNEPQWDWSNKFGQGSQEGSPWTNKEIARVTRSLDSALVLTRSSSSILLTEAGHLEYLYGRKDREANKQIQQLYGKGSSLQVNQLPHVLNVAGGHSYYTDGNDINRITIRKNLADTAAAYGTQFWQTEYSMLGDGYREGKKGRIPAMDCALFLAKVIHDDLVYGNAAAWQLWNSWEPGNADFDTRYFVIALAPTDATFKNGEATATKNLWALGHYSRFIRPGMKRVAVNMQDGFNDIQRAQQVMISAFTGTGKLVMVAVNYTGKPQLLKPELRHWKKVKKYKTYLTTTDKAVNMQYAGGRDIANGIQLPPRSIMTVVIE